MNRIAVGVEYDGYGYHGWQRQENVHSIQAEIEEALAKVADHPIQTVAAGRTDAKVHATNQVLHFDTSAIRSERAWVLGTNAYLSNAIRLLWAKTVPLSFDARKSALSRRYRYVIYNDSLRPSLFRTQMGWYYKELDIQRMREGASYWIGEHDFSAFRASQCQSKTPVREVKEVVIQALRPIITIDIEANAFLHHMVRNMVGVLWKIGSKEAEPLHAKQVLLSKDRRVASITAPPEGLYLMSVRYAEEFGIPKPLNGPLFLMKQEEKSLI